MTRKGPTKKVGDDFARGRLTNARAYLEAAREAFALLDESGNANPVMSQIVNAAIAFADALTASRKSEVNQQDHSGAVKSLRAAFGHALPKAQETRLRRILDQKDEVQYGATIGRMSDARSRLDDLEEFARWAELQIVP